MIPSFSPLDRTNVLVLAVAGASQAVHAQRIATDVATAMGTEQDVRLQSAPLGSAAGPGGRFTIGLGAAYLPRYEGSDEYKARALPLINYRNGRFFAGALTGIGYDLSPLPTVEFGPVLSYRPGRDEDESARLRGLGDIDGGAEVGAFARWRLDPFFLHGSVKRGVGSGPNGTHVRLGAGYGMAFGPSDRLLLDASLDWADREIMQAHFGVAAAQSARSGLPAYSADAGIRRYGLSAAWTHSFTRQWFSTVGATFYRLGDEAAGSPIVQRRSITGVSAVIGHRF